MRYADESKRVGTQAKGKRQEAGPPKGRLVNWTPSAQHKLELGSGVIDALGAMRVLERRLADGYRVSLGGSLDRGGLFAIIREPGEDWSTLRSLAVWASTLERAVLLLGYYLERVNPDFPESLGHAAYVDDW